MRAPPSSPWLFLREGEMSARLKGLGATTPLGPAETWPRALHVALSVCLNASVPMFVCWGAARTFFYNDACLPVLGARHPSALGRSWEEAWPEEWPGLAVSFAAVMEGETALVDHWALSPLSGDDGTIAGVLGQGLEESERRFIERELVTAQRQLALDAAHFGWWSLDLATEKMTVNARFQEIFDLPEGPQLADVVARIHPDDRDRVRAAMERALDPSNTEIVTSTYRVVRGDGSMRWVAGNGVTSVVGEGASRRISRFAGTVLDVTDNQRADDRDRFLLQVDDALRRLEDPDEMTLAVATLLGQHLDADRCAYAEIEDDQDTMNITGDYNRGVPSIRGRWYFHDFGTEVLRLMRAGAAFVVHDVDHHTPPLEDLTAYRAMQIQSVICVSLLKNGRFVSAMAVHKTVPRRWRDDEVELVHNVANRCWESIERARIARSLRARESSLRMFVETANEGIIQVDVNERVVFANEHFCRMLGYSLHEIIGLHALTLVFRDDLLFNAERRERQRQTQRNERFETRLRAKDGRAVWVIGSTVVVSFEGEYEGTYSMVTDITDRRLAEERVQEALRSEQQAREEAERASRMKDEFLATMSHELRTPLNAILGWAHLLRVGSLGADKQASALATIERNARSQAQLIDDVLDVSRIITGRLRLTMVSVDLAQVVKSAVESARPAAEAKQVRLQVLLDPDAGPTSGDPERLQQVVWNLLSNAVKFTPKGGRAYVKLERVASSVELVVADTGEGIDPAFLPHVFERFRQADASITRRHGGLGLGLSIVKQLVELHGGTVSAESEGVGKGAAFRVRLPLVPVRAQMVAPPTEATWADTTPRDGVSRSPNLKGLRILSVDDEADAREVIKTILESCGAEVLTAASAAEGLATVKRDRPHLIVSDIGMPVEDGYGFIRKLRALPIDEGGRTPAVALTAYARTEDRTRALLAGFNTHVTKPVDPQELLVVIARLAEQHLAR